VRQIRSGKAHDAEHVLKNFIVKRWELRKKGKLFFLKNAFQVFTHHLDDSTTRKKSRELTVANGRANGNGQVCGAVYGEVPNSSRIDSSRLIATIK
jgi:hypothetical protein